MTTPGVTLAATTGPFLSDGTLLKPVAVDTTVEDGADLLRTYKVKSGDTLTGIADKFDVSMMTLWWANDLDSKDELHLGQVLTIPPMSGLVLTVTSNDTLDTIAAKYKVDKADIVRETNDLKDPNLVVGQVLVVPGAKGKPIPTPKPVKHPATSHPRTSSGGGCRPPTGTPVAGSSGRSWVAATTSASIHYGIDPLSLFRKNTATEPVYAVYSAIVAQSRQPRFYADWAVPDTVTGRFDMVSLHMALLFRRLRAEKGDGRDFSQACSICSSRTWIARSARWGQGTSPYPRRSSRWAISFRPRADLNAALDANDAGAVEAVLAKKSSAARSGPHVAALARYLAEEEPPLPCSAKSHRRRPRSASGGSMSAPNRCPFSMR